MMGSHWYGCWKTHHECAVARIERCIALVNEQANDDGLWFEAQTAPEGYLQSHLRKLHSAVEDTL